MFDKIIYICPFIFGSASDQYKNQNMCNEVVSEDFFILKYFPNRYKTQKMCNIAVDASLPAFKHVPDWLFTKRILKNLIMIYSLMTKQSLLLKILITSHFVVIK